MELSLYPELRILGEKGWCCLDCTRDCWYFEFLPPVQERLRVLHELRWASDSMLPLEYLPCGRCEAMLRGMNKTVRQLYGPSWLR
jgi:hypothetical protein